MLLNHMRNKRDIHADKVHTVTSVFIFSPSVVLQSQVGDVIHSPAEFFKHRFYPAKTLFI